MQARKRCHTLSSSIRSLLYYPSLAALLCAGLIRPAAGAEDAAATNDDESRKVANAVKGLDAAPGLEATVFAAEPMLLSPTNIDVDHRGRVWVCEVVNYRHRNGSRPEGDRILILEDTNGDGAADNRKIFHQGRDIDSAMGICVLGNRVIVSASPNIFVFTDTDGDDKADTKELLFTKTGNAQHDHAAHAFVFGPDGKLYWNFGNEGKSIHDKDGNPVVDAAGNKVVDDGKPYREGMAFRCNLDGSELEVLGHNFRNNYELAVDSFGTVWQSDNDDDGNRGVRINYVMEFGNYGYKDEITGAGWRTPRTNFEADLPQQHWHLNDPGVVPNLLQTGNGSPTGILVYEGALLPEVYRNQIVHCDAGPNIVRAYSVTVDGAGYDAEPVDILHGARDQWFRPSDVCVAPDGSLIVADWYDPGVGGHRMGDIDRGRIFRIAPPGAKYEVPAINLESAHGAVEALKSPNPATRYLAWTALHNMGDAAEVALERVFSADQNTRFRARTLWLLGNMPKNGEIYVTIGLSDSEPDIRITALRLARQRKTNIIPIVEQLVNDPEPRVRRECAIALRHNPSGDMPRLWAELALKHDGRDRWYLEALGLSADKRWDDCLASWLATAGDNWKSAAGREIVWRSRAKRTPELLGQIISDPATPESELPRYFRAFDFLDDNAKQPVLEQLAYGGTDVSTARELFVACESLVRLAETDFKGVAERIRVLKDVLDQVRGTELFLQLVQKFNVTDRNAELVALAQERPDQSLGVQAIRILLSRNDIAGIEDGLKQQDVPLAAKTIQALGNSDAEAAVPMLWNIADDEDRALELRREAVRGLARFKQAAEALLDRAEANKLDSSLKEAAAAALHLAGWNDVKARAQKIFPPATGRNEKPLPPLAELAGKRGDAVRGRMLFHTTGTCAKCHIVDGLGREVGPNLSEIGDKLSRQACYESILYPSAGISHNYETYVAVLESGNVATGIVISRTPESVTLRAADAIDRTIRLSEVEELRKQEISLMPADLQKTLTEDELVDIVEFLTTLKKRLKPAAE